MDEKTARELAELLDGEAWERDGGWVVSVNEEEDGSIVLYTSDGIFQFDDDDALSADTPRSTVSATIPSAADLWVVVDAKGNIFYQNDKLERGWRFEEDARMQASGFQSRDGDKYFVVQQGTTKVR